MKKLAFLLSIIAMVAIVGGALAFKARSQNYVYVHAAGDPIHDRCTLQSFFLTATNNGNTPHSIVASSIPVNSGCNSIPVYAAQ